MAIEIEVRLSDQEIDRQTKEIAQKLRRELGLAAPDGEFTRRTRETFAKIPPEARKAGEAATREFERGSRGAKGFGDQVGVARRQMQQLIGTVADANPIFGRLADIFDGLGGKTALIGGAAAAAGGAIAALAIRASEYARQVDNAARTTGLSTAQIQALTREATRVGQNFNDVTDAVNQLATQIGDARNGSEELRAVFQRVGVDVTKSSLTTAQALDQVLRKLAAMPPSVEKTVVASRLFGEEGARLILAMQNTGNGLVSLTGHYRELGQVIDSEAIQRSKEFSLQLGELRSNVEATATRLGVALQPAVAQLLQDLEDSVTIISQLVRAFDFLQTKLGGGPVETRFPALNQARRIVGNIPFAGPVAGSSLDALNRIAEFFSGQVVPPRLPEAPALPGRLSLSDINLLIEEIRTGRGVLPTGSLLGAPPRPPRTARAGARTIREPELAPEVESQVRRLGIAFDLVGKDLGELNKAYLENQQRISELRSVIREFADSGALKTREAQKALSDLVAEFDLSAELLGATLTRLQKGPLRVPLALAPAPPIEGDGLIGARRQGDLPPELERADLIRRGFLVDREGQPTTFDIEAARAYRETLERINEEQLQFLEVVVDSQERLNRVFEVNPLELQARTLDGLARRVKSTTEIIADAQIGAIDSVFDFVDRGFDRLTAGVGAFGRVISQVLSDITRLLLHRTLAQFFGIGGAGGGGFSGGGGGGGFFSNILFGGGRAGGGGLPLGFGGFGGGTFGGSIFSGGGGGLLGGLFGSGISAPPSISAAGTLPVNLINRDALLRSAGLGGLASAGASGGLGSLLAGSLGPIAPLLGLSLGAGLGGRLGGPSTLGRILGTAGGGFLGAGAGLLAFGALGGGLSGSAAAFASFALGPIGLLIGGGLLIGSLLLGRAAQRRKDEQAADQIWSEEARQLQELTRQVNSDRIDGAEALAVAAQLRAQTIAQLGQIKTRSVRESRLRNQLADVDRIYVAQLRQAVERQATRQRIGPQLIPEFATGGVVPGFDRTRDSVLIKATPGEVILNRQQQARLELLVGSQVFQQIGVPGFQQGGQVPAAQPVSFEGSSPTVIIQNLTVAFSKKDATELVAEGVSIVNGPAERAVQKAIQRGRLRG